jgi:2-polyprenyl-6-hydroxyphenyl methylase/3-demethylubiquinone-9 3-methyltransferase
MGHFEIDKNKKFPLKNLKILDIGCGGGLISEPMYRLGANVTGIDASDKNIQVAKMHAKKNELKIKYLNSVPENLDEQNKFDIILNLEVIEHVENLDLYLSSCFKLLKKNGIMFTATINRTLTSYIKAIVGAEYILRWLPIGTHDWNKFVKPEELEKKLTDLNFLINDVTGLSYNPILQEWKKTKDMSVNYIITAKKN